MDALSRLPHLDVNDVTLPQSLFRPASSAHLRTPDICGPPPLRHSSGIVVELGHGTQVALPWLPLQKPFSGPSLSRSRFWSSPKLVGKGLACGVKMDGTVSHPQATLTARVVL